MKKLNVNSLKNTILENYTGVSRSNILVLAEGVQFQDTNTRGIWSGYSITQPDGVELTTKKGIRGQTDVYVSNFKGQYRAFDDGIEIELSQVLNESRNYTLKIID